MFGFKKYMRGVVGFTFRHWLMVVVLLPLLGSVLGAVDPGKLADLGDRVATELGFRRDTEHAKYLKGEINRRNQQIASDEAAFSDSLAILDQSGIESLTRHRLVAAFAKGIAEEKAVIGVLERRLQAVLKSRAGTLTDRLDLDPARRTQTALDLARTLVDAQPETDPRAAAVDNLFDRVRAGDVAGVQGLFVPGKKARGKVTAATLVAAKQVLDQRATGDDLSVELRPVAGRADAFEVYVKGMPLTTLVRVGDGWMFSKVWWS